MWPLRRSAEVVGSGFEKEKITGALAAGVVLLGSLGLVWAKVVALLHSFSDCSILVATPNPALLGYGAWGFEFRVSGLCISRGFGLEVLGLRVCGGFTR